MKSLCNIRVGFEGMEAYMVLLSAAERLQGRAGRALKGCQEASTSFHCSRLHLSSLRNTSEILVSLKPLGILTAAPPAIRLGERRHLHCAGVGERYVGTESGAPFLTCIRRSHVGWVPAWGGSWQLSPSHFPCALRPLLFCPAHPSPARTPRL